MRVYQLKSRAQRATAFALAVGMFGIVSAYALPNGKVQADALNPLTERTLLLSSSSPGDHYLDAAGNTTYAAPGSGPNGKQTEETFTFRVSTNSSATGFGAKDTAIQAFTFQYCLRAAGDCIGPGSSGVNLNANYTSPAQGTDFDIYLGSLDGNGDPVVDANGNIVYTKITYDPAKPWTMTVKNEESGTGTKTTANNFITLANPDSTMKPAAGTPYKIVFKASNSNYITNPKSGAFFVRINDYDSATGSNHVPSTTAHVIDGGVTVANVMTDSIEIRTKVLETMSFSVGTENPDMVALSSGSHGTCDAIAVNSPLYMGATDAEFSLEVSKAYDTNSYWRLSSNSSNGASVYYSGYTLSNTVNDQIDPMNLPSGSGTGQWDNAATQGLQSHPGMEQFGLAFAAQDSPINDGSHGQAPTNKLLPLAARTVYANGSGTITLNGTGRFAFDPASDQTPSLLATENTDVVDCTTGKMRYIANIAAVTPAGIYASKVNYLAAPQY